MNEHILIHSLIPLHQLLEGRSYLNGHWLAGEHRITQRNPRDGGGLRQLEGITEAQLQAALQRLPDAHPPACRSTLCAQLQDWLDRIRGCQNALALILASESGQSWATAREQVRFALQRAQAQLDTPVSLPPSWRSSSPRLLHPHREAPIETTLYTTLSTLLGGEPAVVIAPPAYALSLLALAVIADHSALPAGTFNVIGRLLHGEAPAAA